MTDLALILHVSLKMDVRVVGMGISSHPRLIWQRIERRIVSAHESAFSGDPFPRLTGSMIVGIDLGTTNSLIGAMDSGLPILFPDSCGRRLTRPRWSISPTGRSHRGRTRCLALRGTGDFSVKRLMGRRAGEMWDGSWDCRQSGRTGPAAGEWWKRLTRGGFGVDSEEAQGGCRTRPGITPSIGP